MQEEKSSPNWSAVYRTQLLLYFWIVTRPLTKYAMTAYSVSQKKETADEGNPISCNQTAMARQRTGLCTFPRVLFNLAEEATGIRSKWKTI